MHRTDNKEDGAPVYQVEDPPKGFFVVPMAEGGSALQEDPAKCYVCSNCSSGPCRVFLRLRHKPELCLIWSECEQASDWTAEGPY